jgi:hypothetical protein
MRNTVCAWKEEKERMEKWRRNEGDMKKEQERNEEIWDMKIEKGMNTRKKGKGEVRRKEGWEEEKGEDGMWRKGGVWRWKMEEERNTKTEGGGGKVRESGGGRNMGGIR